MVFKAVQIVELLVLVPILTKIIFAPFKIVYGFPVSFPLSIYIDFFVEETTTFISDKGSVAQTWIQIQTKNLKLSERKLGQSKLKNFIAMGQLWLKTNCLFYVQFYPVPDTMPPSKNECSLVV